MGKRDAEINVTGNTLDAQASIKDLENMHKKSFGKMSEHAEKESKEISDAFKKSGIRMERDIKKSSEDARRRYEKIKHSGTASANDIKRAHNSMTATIKRNNRELSTSSKGMIKIFDRMKSRIVLAGAAAVGFFGIKAISESVKFESALLDLQKVLTDTEGDAKDFTGQVEEMSKKFGESSAEILQGVAIFKQAGFDIQESFLLQESALKLVAASELEVAEASELMVASLKGFKAPASDVILLTNILNEVSNNYATNLKELAIGTAELSPIAKKMGFSFAETAGILTPVIEVFRSGSEAAQALKTGLLKLLDDAGPVREALAAMGISQKDLNGDLRSGKDILADVAKRFETLGENQKLFIAQQLTGIRQTAKMVEVFDGLGLSTEITNKALSDMESINKEVAIRLSSTEVKGKRAIESFNIMAKVIGNQLLPVYRTLLDVVILVTDGIAASVRGIAKANQVLNSVGGFFADSISTLLGFSKVDKVLKGVNNEAKELNKTGEDAVGVNKQQEESIEKVTVALIDVKKIRDEERKAIEQNRDTAIAALNAVGKLQRTENKSIREAIKNTRQQLRELEAEAEKASKFSQRILDEIAGSQKRIAQAEFDPLEKIVDDLKRAEDDFDQASKERAAGNIDRARELTLSAVQAANAILEVKKGAEDESEISRSELNKATLEAEKLVEQAQKFAVEMQIAAESAIPGVIAEIETLENQLEAGKETLVGIKESISEAKKLATELKSKLSENTTATHTQIIQKIEAKSGGGMAGELLGFNRGGKVPGGYGGGDKIHALLEPYEHVIKKESVMKLGRPAAVAFNNGDVAGLIAALPVQQKLKDGGEVAGESVNVNLLMGEKSFPMTAEKSVADEFVEDIKDINIVNGRKPNKY